MMDIMTQYRSIRYIELIWINLIHWYDKDQLDTMTQYRLIRYTDTI